MAILNEQDVLGKKPFTSPKKARQQLWLSALVFLLICVAVIVGVILLLPKGDFTAREFRIYIVVFLSLMAGTIMLMVIMSNSIKANTTFLIKLKDEMLRTGKSFDKLENEYRNRANLTKQEIDALKGVKNELNELNRHLTANEQVQTGSGTTSK